MKVIVNVDGAGCSHRANAGVGVVVREFGTELLLAEVSEPLGPTTLMVAEYRAVLRGLQEAERQGADRVILRGDNLVVLEQVAGDCRVPADEEHERLRERCREAAARFASVEVEHVYSCFNQDADRLARKARRRGRRR